MRNYYAAALVAATATAQQAFSYEESNHGFIDLTETGLQYQNQLHTARQHQPSPTHEGHRDQIYQDSYHSCLSCSDD